MVAPIAKKYVKPFHVRPRSSRSSTFKTLIEALTVMNTTIPVQDYLLFDHGLEFLLLALFQWNTKFVLETIQATYAIMELLIN